MVSQIAGLLLLVIITPLMVRHLGPLGFGDYKSVTALMMVVTALSEGGLGTMGVREFAVLPAEDRRRLFQNLMGLRIVLAFAGSLAALLFALLAGYGSALVIGTGVAAFGMILNTLQFTASIPLSTEMRLLALGVINLAALVLQALCVVGLVLAGASLLPFFAVSAATGGLTLIATLWPVRHLTSVWPRFDWGGWPALLRQTIVFGAAGALGTVYFQVALLAMSFLTTGHQRALYALPFQMQGVLNMVPWMIGSSAYPVFARTARINPRRFAYDVRRLTGAVLMLGCLVAVPVVVAAPVELNLLGGAGFAPGPLRIIGIALPMTYLLSIWSYSLFADGRLRSLIICNGAAIAAAIALSILLIPPLGAVGAACVTAALEVTLAVSYGAAVCLTGLPSPLDRRSAALTIGAALVSVAVGFVVPVPVVPAAILCVGIYLALMVVLRLISLEQLTSLVLAIVDASHRRAMARASDS